MINRPSDEVNVLACKQGQGTAPVAFAMKKYSDDGAMAFHTPGHKQGRGAHPLLKGLVTDEGLREEVSLMEELDDLSDPHASIQAAEKLAAELYGVDHALFMVNGTTGAIHAMMMGTLKPGDKVIVPRNIHRSIAGGLILSGAVPCYMQPEVDEGFGTASGVSLETVKRAIHDAPDAKAVLLVYPTYYGVASDIAAISAYAHEHGMMVLVDEAHGAHLPFSSRLPMEAVAVGADAAAVSTHKLLGSMTQTSMLLIRDGRVDARRMLASSGVLTSTSPNQLLLASLDIARLQMAESGTELWTRAIELSDRVRDGVRTIPGLRCYEAEDVPDGMTTDPCKVVVNVTGLGIGGSEAERRLRYDYKIECELADAWNVLFIISYADSVYEADYLVESLHRLADDICRDGANVKPIAGGTLPKIPAMRLTPRDAYFKGTEAIPFEMAVGRIMAEEIMFYPPGIPLVFPGEELSQEIYEYVKERQAMGLRLTGPRDTSLDTVLVVAEGDS